MIEVQKWTTTKGAPPLVFFCNFLLNDQSGRPASGRESRINSYFPRGGPCFLVKPSFSSFVVVLRSRFSCESDQIQGHEGVNWCQ